MRVTRPCDQSNTDERGENQKTEERRCARRKFPEVVMVT